MVIVRRRRWVADYTRGKEQKNLQLIEKWSLDYPQVKSTKLNLLRIKFNLAWNCVIFLELRIRVLKHKLEEMQDCLKLDQLECCKLPWMWNCVITKKKKVQSGRPLEGKLEEKNLWFFLFSYDVLLQCEW
jgi:hypothetical protein